VSRGTPSTDPPSETRRSGMPRWLTTPFLALAVILIPWSLFLVVTLPRRSPAYHWGVAWAGFDLILSLALAGTAIALWRGSSWLLTFAGAAAGLLICDAWFDVLTSSPSARPLAIAEALILEVPLAFACIWVARHSGRSFERSGEVAEAARRLLRSKTVGPSGDEPLP
jgi:hypothetical protein